MQSSVTHAGLTPANSTVGDIENTLLRAMSDAGSSGTNAVSSSVSMVGRHEFIATARENGWRKQCLAWAAAGIRFVVMDLATKDFAFCGQIRSHFGYAFTFQYTGQQSVGQFVPRRQIT